MEELTVTKHGTNSKITARILSDDEMRAAGFRCNDGRSWTYFSMIAPKQEISFTVDIDKSEPETPNIMVLDEDFCQPYDYQRFLEDRPNDPFLRSLQASVEQHMKKLETAGVLFGHVMGEYI